MKKNNEYFDDMKKNTQIFKEHMRFISFTFLITTLFLPLNSFGQVDAVDDDFGFTNPIIVNVGGNTPTLYNNDTLMGSAFMDSEVTPSIINNDGITGLMINGDGTLTVPGSTTVGSYTITYEICETADLGNCDTAVVVLHVEKFVVNALCTSSDNTIRYNSSGVEQNSFNAPDPLPDQLFNNDGSNAYFYDRTTGIVTLINGTNGVIVGTFLAVSGGASFVVEDGFAVVYNRNTGAITVYELYGFSPPYGALFDTFTPVVVGTAVGIENNIGNPRVTLYNELTGALSLFQTNGVTFQQIGVTQNRAPDFNQIASEGNRTILYNSNTGVTEIWRTGQNISTFDVVNNLTTLVGPTNKSMAADTAEVIYYSPFTGETEIRVADGTVDGNIINSFTLGSGSRNIFFEDNIVFLNCNNESFTSSYTVDLTASIDTATEGGLDGEFTATLNTTNVSGAAIVIPVAMSGIAADGTDYTSIVNISIPNGSATGTVLVDAALDGLIEGDETAIASLGTLPSGVVAGTSTSGTVTITDATSYTVDLTASINTATEGGADGEFTATLDAVNTSGAAIVIPVTMSGTAADGTDYTSIVNISIPNGSATGTVLVDAALDGLIEGDETAIASLGTLPSGVVAGTSTSGTVTITDATSYTVDLTASINTATEGGADGEFTATLDAVNTSGAAIVIPVTMSGTAADGTDYTSIMNISIPNGSATDTVLVDAPLDGLIEGDETAIASLGTLPSGVVAGTSTSGTVTITDATSLPSTPTVTITEDINNDGVIDGSELDGNIDVTITLPSDAVAGDVLTIDGVDQVLTASDITNGSVTIILPNPGDGNTIMVIATITDSLGNTSAQGEDSALIDTGLANLALTKTGVYVDSNNNGIPNTGDEIQYEFTIVNTGNVDITNIVITDLLPGIILNGDPIDLAAGEIDTDNFIGIYTLTEEDILAGNVVNQAFATGQATDGMDVVDLSDDPFDTTDIDTDGDGDFEDETVTIINSQEDDIIIYEGISPNGDGVNDQFRIIGLSNFPNNTLKIFNRWGVLVFDQNGYEQPGAKFFKGISEGRVTIKDEEELPVGTYYFVLQYENASGAKKSKAGYLYISR